MRYCKRTFFNKLLQPKRIGKPIFKTVPNVWKAGKFDRTYWNMHNAFQPRKTMLMFRRGKTPKNLIVGRHSMVKYFRARTKLNLRPAQSVFLRRLKHYVS